MTRIVTKARERGIKPPKSRLIALYPLAIERDYARAIRVRLRALHRAIKSALNPDKRVDSFDLLSALEIVSQVGLAHETQFRTDGPDRLEVVATRVVEFQSRQIGRLIGNVVAIEPATIRAALNGIPLDQLIEAWITRNIQLITNAETAYLAKVQKIITDGFNDGETLRTLGNAIAAAGKSSTRRGSLLARDQIATLNSNIQRTRQTALGINKYRWTTSYDERVRPEHAERRNKTFDWNSPPSDGHPGEPIMCRCVATPIIPEDLDFFNDA